MSLTVVVVVVFVVLGLKKQKEVKSSKIQTVMWMPNNFLWRLSHDYPYLMRGMSKVIVMVEKDSGKVFLTFFLLKP